jgi:predicted DNA-binding protein
VQSLNFESLMELHFTPEMEERLDRLASETCRTKEELVQDAMPGYFDGLAQLRKEFDRRYDDLKGGKAKLIRAMRWRGTSKPKSPRAVPGIHDPV